ncbi:hypothetical protein JHK86_007055 [Glycine max]|nr:hypothetical protein JHK86_007055 [Glycine max]
MSLIKQHGWLGSMILNEARFPHSKMKKECDVCPLQTVDGDNDSINSLKIS